MGSRMIRWLLEVVFFATWISIFGTEQVPGNDPPLVASRTGILSPAIIVRVLNFEGRIVKNAVVWEGTEVTIICKVHGFSKETRLSWTEPSGKTSFPTDQGIRITKIFNKIAQSNSGQYICNVSDPESGQYLTKSVLLKVEATPTIHTNNVTVLEGKHAVLRCIGTNQTQSYTISWLREGRELHSDANTGQTKLTFYSVNRRHAGTYECKITIGQVKISAYPRLTVVYPPEILEGPRNVTAKIGDTVAFRCNVTGYPEPVVTWQLYGMALHASNASTAQIKYIQSSEKGTQVLKIADVQQAEDGGRYSCYVGNNNGTPLSATAYLQIQGPPSPPMVKVAAIYGKDTAVLAVLNWTEPDHDGNSPIVAYKPGCKRKSRDKFLAAQVHSDVFSSEILCAFVNGTNETLPYLLHLLLRVKANNALGSTSSELLDLTVEVRAAENNQSAFEVFMLTSTPLPTRTTTTSINQTYLGARSTSISEGQHTTSPLLSSDDASSSGDSHVSTTEWWPHFTESKPPGTTKALSTSFPPTAQFVPEADSNNTDFEDDGNGDFEPTYLIHVVLGVAFVVVLVPVVVGVIAYVRGRYLVEQNIEQQHEKSSEESPKHSATELSVHLEDDPRECFEESCEGPATESCTHVEFQTTCAEGSFQAADQLSESLNVTSNQSFHLAFDHGNRPAILVESTSHPVSLPIQKAEQLPESLDRSSHCDQDSPATLVESTVHPVSFQAAEQLSKSLTGLSHVDQGSHSAILVENVVHPFSTGLDVTVGPEGGEFHSGTLLLSVPKEAVQSKQQIIYQFQFGTEPIDISEDWFICSPVLVLEPHNFHFQKSVRVRFPFTAMMEGWILVLTREEPEKGWKTVLTLDTDTRQVTQQDLYCNYDVNKRLLRLKHFCKYRWCGYRKRNASRLEKMLACSLFARMDTSGNSCNFTLYLTDNCHEVITEIEKKEGRDSENFEPKDFERVIIGTDGVLTIQFTTKGFQIEETTNYVKIAIKDLWRTHGCHKRVLFSGNCVGRTDGSKDPELHVRLSTSDRCENMRAVFRRVGELAQGTCFQNSTLQQSPSLGAMAAQDDHADKIESSSVDSSCDTESEPSSSVAKLSPTTTSESNSVWPQLNSGIVSPVSENSKGTEILRQHWTELVVVLDPELVIDGLFQLGVINDQELDEIRYGQGAERRKKANMLLSKMLRRSDTAVRQFAEILSRTGSEKHEDLGERLLKRFDSEAAGLVVQPT